MNDTAAASRRFVFLDRDGVINVELGEYTIYIEQLQWAEGSLAGIKKLNDAGFKIIVITNQACISKGLQTEEGLAKLHNHMKAHIEQAGGSILAFYHCPHQTPDNCFCRKPQPGMLVKAAEDYGINLPETFFIGDSRRDMEAGRRAGTRTILIDNGIDSDSPQTQFETGEFRVNNLLEATEIVIGESKRRSEKVK
ncbi:D-glycero-alpha-D-manno-heptose-1,7-bisphosphate 7-phosphatase [Candidatus Omnitrophota bacterium]